MKFYRLESKTEVDPVNKHVNRGAYRCGVGPLALPYELSEGVLPDPDTDKGMAEHWTKYYEAGTHRDWYCGFNSLDQYKGWFFVKEGRSRAAETGRIAVYEIDEKYVHIGEYHSIARVDKLKLINILPTDIV